MNTLKSRMRSAQSIKKITKAMHLVATVHLRRARDQLHAAREYTEAWINMFNSQRLSMQNYLPSFITGRQGSLEYCHLLVVCTSNRGLCGGFNAALLRLVRLEADKLLSEGKKVIILPIGKRGHANLIRYYKEMVLNADSELVHNGRVSPEKVLEVTDNIADMFNKNKFDVCLLFYNSFISTMKQVPHIEQLVPYSYMKDTKQVEYTYDTDKKVLVDHLCRHTLYIHLYKALMENSVGEQAARMMAMNSATGNSDELLKKLTLLYNRLRQQKITDEIIEIVSGASIN